MLLFLTHLYPLHSLCLCLPTYAYCVIIHSPKHNQIIDANALSGNGLKNAAANAVLLHSTQALKKNLALTSNTSEVNIVHTKLIYSLASLRFERMHIFSHSEIVASSIELNIDNSHYNSTGRLDNTPANGMNLLAASNVLPFLKSVIIFGDVFPFTIQVRSNKNGSNDGPILLQTLKRLDKTQSKVS